MTNVMPVQEFQIGQRVRRGSEPPFIIRAICLTNSGFILYSISEGYPYFTANELTLAPERPPYVPSERRVVVTDYDHTTRIAYYQRYCRCETDDEMAARHAIERAEYDCPCPADPVIYNARGESIGITGRTSLDGPGAA